MQIQPVGTSTCTITSVLSSPSITLPHTCHVLCSVPSITLPHTCHVSSVLFPPSPYLTPAMSSVLFPPSPYPTPTPYPTPAMSSLSIALPPHLPCPLSPSPYPHTCHVLSLHHLTPTPAMSSVLFPPSPYPTPTPYPTPVVHPESFRSNAQCSNAFERKYNPRSKRKHRFVHLIAFACACDCECLR